MWAARHSWHPVTYAVAVVAAVGVGAVLGPNTPGPVLGAGWRLAVAVALGMLALSVVHTMLRRPRRESADDLAYVLRIGVAVLAAVVVTTAMLSYLLAAVTPGPVEVARPALEAGLPIDPGLLVVAVVLGVSVLATALADRVAVPGALLFLTIGMVVGDGGLGWLNVTDPQTVQSLGVVALTVVLFNGGLGTTGRQLRAGLGPGLVLATVGVAITAGVTALGAMWLLDVPARPAWLLGAIVASTDATAVFAMVRRAPLPPRLASIIQLESATNDPVAILLTVGLLAGWSAPPDAGSWLAFGAMQLIGGVAVGVAGGWAGARVIGRVRLATAGLYPILALAVGWLTYGVAATIGASGFLAIYVAGVVLGADQPRRRATVQSFTDALASGAEVGLFLLLGLLVVPSQLPGVTGVALGVTALLVLVARPLAVLVGLAPFALPVRELAATAWLGLRGAVPIVLATLTFSAGLDDAQLIFDVVFFVVLASTLLQGPTAGRLVRWLGLETVASVTDQVVETTPLDDVGIDMVELTVGPDSPLVERRLAEVAPPPHALVVALVRDGQVHLPRGTTRLRAGDRLVLATDDQDTGWEDLRRWSAGSAVDEPADRPDGR